MNQSLDCFRLLLKLQTDLDTINAEQIRCWNAGDGESVGLLVERGQKLVREITIVRNRFALRVARA